MTTDELIQRYLDDLKICNYSKRTIEDRYYNLRLLNRYLKEEGIESILEINTDRLRSFRYWLMNEPTKTGHIRGVANLNRILSCIKSLFGYLKKYSYINYDPAEILEYGKEPRTLPRNVLTPQEAKKILNGIDTKTTLGYRDRTIFEVFYATGIRQQELMKLEVRDVRFEEELLFIREGKGAKDRMVPLSQTACEYIETYIKGIRPELLKGKQSKRLFITYRGNPLDRNNINIICRKHADNAKIKKHVTCHVWRHSCATHLLKNNANLRHVQAILGHGSLATTERYLRLNITDLKLAHKKCHPREKGRGKK